MKDNSDDADLQENAVRLLAILANSKTIRGALMKEGAVTAVATATEKHRQYDDMKRWAGRFMKLMYS